MKVLLDANLATLLVLGSADRRLIGTHKRISRYSRRDFDELTAELARSEAVVFLPNALTEVSNLIGSATYGDLKRRVFEGLRSLIEGSEEYYVCSMRASERQEFRWLGLTDAALLALDEPNTILLTDDNELYVAAVTSGRPARNFRHTQAER